MIRGGIVDRNSTDTRCVVNFLSRQTSFLGVTQGHEVKFVKFGSRKMLEFSELGLVMLNLSALDTLETLEQLSSFFSDLSGLSSFFSD